ncbi:MAG: pyruvate ferredoxin oxidoreductase [Gaiellaceae bacterium]
MSTLEQHLLTGGEAVAHALCQIQPDVVPVYPITPQTPIIQTFSSLVANGAAHTEIVNVESEHSAMSAAIGAALAGARTATATSSQGLALMAEVVYVAASRRAPLTMAVGNRALSGPINIHCDHSDSMLVRDSGVVQLFAENAQEAYDLMVMAPRIAEHPDVLLPVLVCQDGFTITHAAEPISMLPDDDVRAFVGEYRTPVQPLLDAAHPATHGPFAMPDYYFEFRRAQAAALEAAAIALAETAEEYSAIAGRSNDAVEQYRLGDAETVLVALGSTAGTVKDVVDELRDAGERVGLLKIRSFRPFPAESVRLACAARDVVVLDRADSPGGAPPLAADVAFALAGQALTLRSHVYGLGGRDLHPDAIKQIFRGEAAPYVGVRGEPCLA